jgi:predicted porin
LTGNAASSAQGQQGLTFNRQAFVALGGGFGEVRLGRDYAPTFWNLTVYDPFSTVGVGSTLNVTLGALNPAGASIAPPGTPKPEVRTSNAISYFLPTNIVPGLTGQVTYAFSEVVSSCTAIGVGNGVSSNGCVGVDDDGRYVGFRVGYTAGPLSVALASGRTTYANSNVAAIGLAPAPAAQQRGDYNATNLGLSYDLGVAKLLAQYGIQTQDANQNQTVPTDQKLTHWLLGASVPLGAGEFKASYNHGSVDSRAIAVDNSRDQAQLALGYVHNLSKRTALYGTYSRLLARGTGAVASQALNSQAAAADQTVGATGYDIGIRHNF